MTFERTKGLGGYFPNVHIAPVNNGCLLTAAYYIISRMMPMEQMTPMEFIETLAVGNYCKYTIEGKRNQDYVRNAEYLEESREYIKADFQRLKPDMIILPMAIYKTEQRFIDEWKGSAKVVPIYQLNAGTINRTIKGRGKYPPYELEELTEPLRSWVQAMNRETLRGKTGENYRCVFRYLDEVMKSNNLL